MLDALLIQRDPEGIKQALAKRGMEVDFSQFLDWDSDFRRLHQEVEATRAQRNVISADIPKVQRGGGDITELRGRSKALAAELTRLEERLAEVSRQRQEFLDGLPNVPDADVPAGGKESNTVLRESGSRPKFDFETRDHVRIAQDLGIIDYARGAKLNGTGSWVYIGDGALLEWALLNYFVESHVRDGYTFVLPPHMLTYENGYAAGQFPKFADDVYHLTDDGSGTRRFMVPTSETALVNFHRDETLPESELPKRYFSYTPCYRREIGGYRSAERGTLRGHQFNKVEMFQFTSPENSDHAHEELVRKAEELVAGLGLHYRVSLLAAGDTSASMTKTYDVEVWLPSLDGYMEVSSISNAREYQARRAKIRYKRESDGKSAFVHTLNGSGLATSRLLPAVLEQFQLPDGTVEVPPVLRKWLPSGTLAPQGR